MKGTFFSKPLEFRLQVDGESWRQGDPIRGALEIKNHGPEPMPLDQVHVHLAYADMKHVRAKAADAFEILKSAPVTSGVLSPGATHSLEWKFETDRNFPITDSISSPYVIYGAGEAQDKLGQLQLPFTPEGLVEQFIDVLKTQFRFVLKTQKFSKGSVETKLAPPTAKEFQTLELLFVLTRFEEDKLVVEYKFQVKKIAASASNIDVKKEKRTLEQSFEKSQYLTASGRFNYETVEQAIQTALDTVRAKIVY